MREGVVPPSRSGFPTLWPGKLSLCKPNGQSRNQQQATPDRPPAPLTISASDGEDIDQGPDSESLPLLHQVDQWISGSQTLEPLGPRVFPFPQLSTMTMGRTTHDMTCLPGVPSVEEKKIERLSRKDCPLPSPSPPFRTRRRPKGWHQLGCCSADAPECCPHGCITVPIEWLGNKHTGNRVRGIG